MFPDQICATNLFLKHPFNSKALLIDSTKLTNFYILKTITEIIKNHHTCNS